MLKLQIANWIADAFAQLSQILFKHDSSYQGKLSIIHPNSFA